MRRLATALFLTAVLSVDGASADSIGDVRTGNAAFGDGRYEAAVEAFTRAILAGDLEPDALAITFNNRGVAYSELGDFDQAIKDYAQALGLTPGDATAIRNLRIAHIRRAAAASQLGEKEAARADYDRAIELDPAHPLAYMRRGQLALERGDSAAAIADLRRARELDPQNADITAQIANAERAATAQAAPAPAPAPTVPEPAAPAPGQAPAPGPTIPAGQPDSTAAAAAEYDYSIDPPGGRPPAAAPAAPATATAVQDGAGRTFRALADVNVRQGPGNDYPRISGVVRGATVRVVGERQGWLELRLSNGGSGWVYRKWLEDVGTAQP